MEGGKRRVRREDFDEGVCVGLWRVEVVEKEVWESREAREVGMVFLRWFLVMVEWSDLGLVRSEVKR